jgi:DNA primase
MRIPYYIEQILKEKKITDFLAERGITPARQYADKLIYHCPIHEGDNDPSFVVYTNGEYQTYFCFACHTSSNIIHLVREMDNISIKDTIKKLIKGININEQDVLNSIIKDLENGLIKEDNKGVEKLFFKLNRSCYDYLKDINFDEEEINFFDKVFNKIDKIARDRDEIILQDIYDFIIEQGVNKRIDKYIEKKEKLLEKEIK